MDVYECLKTRLTVRQFKPDPVPEEVVTRILEAGRWSPSSRNQQPWHFVVIRDRDTLKSIGRIATSGGFVAAAPLAIAIVMENADVPELDAGRALQQMEVMAWSEGLGTCFVGLAPGAQTKKVKELLGVPAEMKLITVLPFGYRPDGVRGTRRRRKPLSEMAHSERFGVSYSAR
jgi:nitroreductase